MFKYQICLVDDFIVIVANIKLISIYTSVSNAGLDFKLCK